MTEQEQNHGTSPIASVFIGFGTLMFTVAIILLLLGLDGYGLRAAVIAFGLMALAVVIQKVLERVFNPAVNGDPSE